MPRPREMVIFRFNWKHLTLSMARHARLNSHDHKRYFITIIKRRDLWRLHTIPKTQKALSVPPEATLHKQVASTTTTTTYIWKFGSETIQYVRWHKFGSFTTFLYIPFFIHWEIVHQNSTFSASFSAHDAPLPLRSYGQTCKKNVLYKTV